METSLFLAKLLGPYFIIVAVGVLFNLKFYYRVMEDFSKNTALLYLGGIMALFFGLLIVLFHNVWAFNWAVIITLMGWLGIIKGIWIICFPNTIARMTAAYVKKGPVIVINLIVILILGIVLSVMGYLV
ncbi:hypothetical protein ACFL5E_02610 [Candidatus Omnitrophota bacterium]